jgi:phosphoribosylformylglycinamidine cyclo-ligase
VAAQVFSGIARGCRANGCALIGGETAEMPGMYADGEYDLAGFIVGAAERTALLTGRKIAAGDILLGLPSTGLHTNGYSLARKLLFEIAGYPADAFVPELESTVADELLKVHRSYLKPIRKLLEAGVLKGAAHITGGGITDNTPRILPAKLGVEIGLESWPLPPVFALLRRIGEIPDDDLRRTFNLGIGMILVVSPKDRGKAEKLLQRMKEPHFAIGRVVPRKRGRPRVEYR